MSTLSVTTLNTANGTTDLTVSSGNTSASRIVVAANGAGLLFQSGAGANNLVINTTAASFNGTVADSTAIIRPLVLETTKSATGTAVEFTGIPSWVRRITVILNGVSTNGASRPMVQIGSGSFLTSGYTAYGAWAGFAQNFESYTAGFGMGSGNAANLLYGHYLLTTMGSNVWVASHTVFLATAGYMLVGSGTITLSGTLDRVRLSTANGTDAFDAGSVNIMYE